MKSLISKDFTSFNQKPHFCKAVTSKFTVTSKIISGKYAGWTCILLDGKDRFVRTSCLKLGEKRLK